MAEARTGPRRARPFGFLPVLALLLGALGLFAPAPAAAQTWSAVLTVKAPDGDRGCFATTGDHACTAALDDDDFTVGDTDYDVYGLVVSETQGGTKYLYLYLNRKIPDAVKALKLCLGTTGFALSEGRISDDTPANDDNVVQWSSTAVSGIPSWSVGDTVAVSLASSCEAETVPAAADPAAPTFDPANGATETDASTNITLTFDEAIKADAMATPTEFTNTTVKNILTLKSTNAAGTDIAFAASINSAKTKITINPTANLADGAVYVAISDSWYDADGNQGGAANVTFTVDTTGPAAPTFDPADGDTETDAGTDITLTFAEPIKANSSGTDFTDTTVKSILTLKSTDEDGDDIAFAASINAAKTIVTIDPTADLADGDVYVAISDGHYDAHGNQGAAANATFTVAAPPTPAAVTELSATRGVRKLDLSWTAPTGTVTGYDVHYTTSATVKDDSPDADPSGNDPSAAWVDAGHTGDGTTVSDEITGLTPLTLYYVRVRAVNDAGNGPWEVVLGIPLPEPHGPLLTPDFDLLVKLTFNDGVRDLPMITTGAGDSVGIGIPFFKYYVYVPPGVVSVTMTPFWTNPSITGLRAARRYLSSGNQYDTDTTTWNSDQSGTGKTVSLVSTIRPAAPGMSQLDIQVQGVTSTPYRIYLQHHNGWKSANDRLNALAIEIGQ